MSAEAELAGRYGNISRCRQANARCQVPAQTLAFSTRLKTCTTQRPSGKRWEWLKAYQSQDRRIVVECQARVLQVPGINPQDNARYAQEAEDDEQNDEIDAGIRQCHNDAPKRGNRATEHEGMERRGLDTLHTGHSIALRLETVSAIVAAIETDDNPLERFGSLSLGVDVTPSSHPTSCIYWAVDPSTTLVPNNTVTHEA